MKALIGTVGLASVEVSQQLPTDGTPTSEVIKIVIQLIIGLATLVGIFKKPKPTPTPTLKN